MAVEMAGGGAKIPTSASSDSSTFLNHGAEDTTDNRLPSPNPFEDPPFHRSAISISTDLKQLSASSPRANKKRPHSDVFEGDPLKNSLLRRSKYGVSEVMGSGSVVYK